ncbi:hypothetical protein EVAR_39914_1 [Eumeta japonica]|uniref:Uncharacterized protein n=1 Tax=Eumeta variegata TaxID=151549 RepID=A0A4C1WQQ9_EUMVA|nr:hypothetical protein EVAR_39914_1 [Eumeta japonica]
MICSAYLVANTTAPPKSLASIAPAATSTRSPSAFPGRAGYERYESLVATKREPCYLLRFARLATQGLAGRRRTRGRGSALRAAAGGGPARTGRPRRDRIPTMLMCELCLGKLCVNIKKCGVEVEICKSCFDLVYLDVRHFCINRNSLLPPLMAKGGPRSVSRAPLKSKAEEGLDPTWNRIDIENTTLIAIKIDSKISRYRK